MTCQPYLAEPGKWGLALYNLLLSESFLNTWAVQVASAQFSNIKQQMYEWWLNGDVSALRDEMLKNNAEAVRKVIQQMVSSFDTMEQLAGKISDFMTVIALRQRPAAAAGEDVYDAFRTFWQQVDPPQATRWETFKDMAPKVFGAVLYAAGAAFIIYQLVTGQGINPIEGVSLGLLSTALIIKSIEKLMALGLGSWLQRVLANGQGELRTFASKLASWFTEGGIQAESWAVKVFGKSSAEFFAKRLGPALALLGLAISAWMLANAIKTGDVPNIVFEFAECVFRARHGGADRAGDVQLCLGRPGRTGDRRGRRHRGAGPGHLQSDPSGAAAARPGRAVHRRPAEAGRLRPLVTKTRPAGRSTRERPALARKEEPMPVDTSSLKTFTDIDDRVKQMVLALPDFRVGDALHGQMVAKLQGAVPGDEKTGSFISSRSIAWRDLLFPKRAGVDGEVSNRLVNATGLGDGWWSDFAVAAVCQSIGAVTGDATNYVDHGQVDQAVAANNTSLRSRLSSPYAYMLQTGLRRVQKPVQCYGSRSGAQPVRQRADPLGADPRAVVLGRLVEEPRLGALSPLGEADRARGVGRRRQPADRAAGRRRAQHPRLRAVRRLDPVLRLPAEPAQSRPCRSRRRVPRRHARERVEPGIRRSRPDRTCPRRIPSISLPTACRGAASTSRAAAAVSPATLVC